MNIHPKCLNFQTERRALFSFIGRPVSKRQRANPAADLSRNPDQLALFASPPACDVPKRLRAIYHFSPPRPPSQPHDGPLRQTTCQPAYAQCDTHTPPQRLSCCVTLVLISATSSGGGEPNSVPKDSRKKIECLWRLYASNSPPPPPRRGAAVTLSSRGSRPKRTLHLSCFVINSVAAQRHTNTCPSAPAFIDLTSAPEAAAVRESVAFGLVLKMYVN